MVTLLHKSEMTIPQLAKSLKITHAQVGKLLIELGLEHPGIARIGDSVFIDDARFKDLEPLVFNLTKESGKIGVISCTHFGSKYQQLSYLFEFYEECYKEGVSHVLNCGDVTEGNGYVYRGQRFEMFLQGFSEQRDYAVENYPKQDGIETWMVAGNHDDSFAASAGIEIVREIADKREDIEYLGRYSAIVQLQDGNTSTLIHHGEGGGAYAISYKMQKYIENIAPDEKPQLFFLGHFHRIHQLFLRNIHGFGIGCFQSQTPYLKRKKLDPAIGGYIIEYDVNEKDGWTLKKVKVSIVPFYKPIKNDYKNYPH